VVKSNIDVAGTPTTQGIRAFADAYPQMDAPVVERMKGHGARDWARFSLTWDVTSLLVAASDRWDKAAHGPGGPANTPATAEGR
jgi:hypothetical protein